MAGNKKTIWSSLTPGMKFAAIVGAFAITAMHQGFMNLISKFTKWAEVKFIFAFLSLFLIPLIYAQGIGILLATLYDLFFKKKD